MNITQVKVTKLTDSKTLAFASITFDECFVVTGLKVLNGKNGLWVAFPNVKTNKQDDNGKDVYRDTAFPITKDFREVIMSTVLNEYNKDREISNDERRDNTIDILDDETLPF